MGNAATASESRLCSSASLGPDVKIFGSKDHDDIYDAEDLFAVQRRFEAMLESELCELRIRAEDFCQKMFEETSKHVLQAEARTLRIAQELDTLQERAFDGQGAELDESQQNTRSRSALMESQRAASLRARSTVKTDGSACEEKSLTEDKLPRETEVMQGPLQDLQKVQLLSRDTMLSDTVCRECGNKLRVNFSTRKWPTGKDSSASPLYKINRQETESTMAGRSSSDTTTSVTSGTPSLSQLQIVSSVKKNSFAELLTAARNAWPIPEPMTEEAQQRATENSTSSAVMRFSVFRDTIFSDSDRFFHLPQRKTRTGDASLEKHVMQRFMMMPSSKWTLCFDVLGICFVGYDVVMIPFLQAFSLEPTYFLKTVGLMAVIFWTLDILRTFFVGYHVNGLIEMRPLRVAKHYARTWLFADLFIVMLDWVFVLIGSESENDEEPQGLLRITRSVRALRVLRILRLLRLAKVHRLVRKISADLHGEYLRMTLELMYIITILLVLCHYVACFWFWLSDSPNNNTSTWVTLAGLENAPILQQYLTSLHWSLTQFSPATVEIHPVNVVERLYANCIVLFGLLAFSTFLSNITSKMSILRKKYFEQQQKEDVLWRYLSENKVSVELGRCILDIHFNKMRERSRRLQEKDIAILEDLPYFLGKQLHLEVYDSFVATHPFFWRWRHVDTRSYATVCHTLMTELSILGKQDLFLKGEICTKMYFIVNGSLCYVRGQANTPISKGDWLSEATLWLSSWMHRGRLGAMSLADIVGVDAKASRVMMHESTSKPADFVRAYVAHFLRDELETDSEDNQMALQHSDVWGGHDSINKLAAKSAIQVWGRDSFSSNKGNISVFSLSSLQCSRHESDPNLPTILEESDPNDDAEKISQ